MIFATCSKRSIFIALVLLVTLFSACDEVQQVLFPKPAEEPPIADPSPDVTEIPIGVVLALTGQYAAALGLPMRDGFELAREEINSSGQLGESKLSFIVEDTQSVSAVEAVNTLIDQHGVFAMTGFAISTQLQQVIPIAARKRGYPIEFGILGAGPERSGRLHLPCRTHLSGAQSRRGGGDTPKIQLPKRGDDISWRTIPIPTRSEAAFKAALIENGVDGAGDRDLSKITTPTFRGN